MSALLDERKDAGTSEQDKELELQAESPEDEGSLDVGHHNEGIHDEGLQSAGPLDEGPSDQPEEEDQGTVDITTEPVRNDELDITEQVVEVEVAIDQQIVIAETATTPGERQIKGRPRHPFKDLYFEQQGEKSIRTNRYHCKCNFCGEVFDGRGELLEKHIIVKCLQVSESVREQAARVVADRAPKDGDPKKGKKRPAGDADGEHDDKKRAGVKVPRGPRSGKRVCTLALEALPLGAVDESLTWTDAEQLRRMVACHVAPGGEGASVLDSQPLLQLVTCRDSELGGSGRPGRARHVSDIPVCQLAAEPYPWPSSGDLRPQTTVLLILDMQKDFCCPGGYADQLGSNITLAREIIPAIQSVMDTCRRLGFRVIFTRETYRKDLSNCPTPRQWRTNRMGAGVGSMGSMGRFLVEGEDGWDIVSDLYPSANDTVINKSSRGAFYSTDLDLVLRRWGISNLLLTGVSTDVCVLSTMRQADDRGYDCVVLEDCCGGTDGANKAGALNTVKAEGGVFGAVSNSISFLEAVRGMETTEPWIC